MSSNPFTWLFLLALGAYLLVRVWLAARQRRHVLAHRRQVPEVFERKIGLTAHQRAADYTIAKLRLGSVELVITTVFLLTLTLGGGIGWLHEQLLRWLPDSAFVRQLLLLIGVMVLSGLLDLPVSLYRQFGLEQRFGFNRMTLKLYLQDLLKGLVVGAILGLPLLAAVLWIMNQAGEHWWLWAWLLWMGFNVTVLLVYPTLIAPLFNKFVPLEGGDVRSRIERLMARCGFQSNGLFVMDGSKRSAHGNAYFTGLGRSKRIVFFDTLLAKLDPPEIEAVLAHELGHFRHRHILKRIVLSFAGSLLVLALLGYLAQQAWFYAGLGTQGHPQDWPALALLLFFLVLPVFTFVLQPLASGMSRRHEFQADAFAAEQTNANDLVRALVKLYEDNASTLTPDPLHSAFYDSHPPAAQRIRHLSGLMKPATQAEV